MFENGLKQKLDFLWPFFTYALQEPNPNKNVQVLLQTLNSGTNTKILAPEFVGVESEMVV